MCSPSSPMFPDQSVRAQVREHIPLHGKVRRAGNESSLKQLGDVTPKIFDIFQSFMWHPF